MMKKYNDVELTGPISMRLLFSDPLFVRKGMHNWKGIEDPAACFRQNLRGMRSLNRFNRLYAGRNGT